MSANQAKSSLVSVTKLDTNEARFVKPVLIQYNLARDGKQELMKWEAVLAHVSRFADHNSA